MDHRIRIWALIDSRHISDVHEATARCVLFVLFVQAQEGEVLDETLGWFIEYLVDAGVSERAVLPFLHEHFPPGPAV